MSFPEWNLNPIKHLHFFQLLTTIFLLMIHPVTCAMAWSSVHTNVVLLTEDYSELVMRFGRYCSLPWSFVSYFLKLEESFYRLPKEVNLQPPGAYADYGSTYSSFAACLLLSFNIIVRVCFRYVFHLSFDVLVLRSMV